MPATGAANIGTYSAYGLALIGNGSTNDISLLNSSGNFIWSNTAGSVNSSFAGYLSIAGYLGIGTTSPTDLLTAVKNDNTTGYSQVASF